MSDIRSVLAKQNAFFNSNATRNVSFRIEQLKILRQALGEYEDQIASALKSDLNKSPFEAYATETGLLLDDIKRTIRQLPSWAKTRRVKTPLMHFPSTSYVIAEPYGVSLIMSPWNYPLQLAIAPLIGSMAGGNCTVIKPSEYSPATSAVMARMLRQYFQEDYIAVVEGGVETCQSILAEKFDYIFFTGSVPVGKLVMQAAARHLTPVTLELGGKSPCIVDREVNLDLAARRIVWGKFINAGQTCVAPDYVLVHHSDKSELIAAMAKYIRHFYSDQPCQNEDYPKIISERHFERLVGFLGDGRLAVGGQYDENCLKLAPTIIEDISWDDPVMQDEIFGPILPVLGYDELSEVISKVKSRPRPLALYLFTANRENESRIINNISFGGGCINDTIIHLVTPYMPFGGIGESGMGGYHGKASFMTFTHQKSIMKKANWLDIELRYPPYQDKLALLRKVLK